MASSLAFSHALSGTSLRLSSNLPSVRRQAASPQVSCAATSHNATSESVSNAPVTGTDTAQSTHSHAQKTSRRRLIMGTMTAGMISAIGCPLCDQGLNLQTANAAEWSYGDLSGPGQWGELCQAGTTQSPIDLPSATSASPLLVADNSPGPLNFKYNLASASYLNTGHGTMQVNFPAGSNTCEIGGRKLQLLQYHFHAPSEHSFNGVRTAMEVHLVHKDEEGKLAVVGVMLEAAPKAPRNLCVEAALAFAPDEKGVQIGAPVQCFDVPVPVEGDEELTSLGPKTVKQCIKIQISPKPLLPKADRNDGTHSYIHYKGSLTTPPCSEGVDWFVLLSPLYIPDAQVVEFMRYVGDKKTLGLNSRPRQDLGERQLYLGPAVAQKPAEEAPQAAA